MLQTTIGTRRKESKNAAVTAANKVVSDKMQRWLEANGMGVYTPQAIDGESVNLSVEYNAATKGLNWKDQTIAHLAGLPVPPIIQHYGGYFCGSFGATTWRTIRFPDPANPAVMLTQDDLTLDQLTMYLRYINGWFKLKKIAAVMFMDEPAHKSSDAADPGEYGWTPEAEARNIKWAWACVGAGFELRIAMPGPSQLNWWLPKLPPQTVWVLHEANDPKVFQPLLPANTPVWIYNVRAVTLPTLAQRLKQFKAAGYPPHGVLMWNANSWTHDNDMPMLFDLSGPEPLPSAAMFTFIEQLKIYSGEVKPPEPKPATWQEGYAMLDARLKAGGL